MGVMQSGNYKSPFRKEELSKEAEEALMKDLDIPITPDELTDAAFRCKSVPLITNHVERGGWIEKETKAIQR